MNYLRIYNQLVCKAKNRQYGKSKKNLKLEIGPIERHHIIPVCMNGSNNNKNLIYLTPSEHYFAHELLVKIYPNNNKLLYAVKMMCHNSPKTVRNNKLYGWIKKAYIESISGQNNPQYGLVGELSPNYGRIGPMTGKTHTKDSKEQMSKSRSGDNHWTVGKSKEEMAMFGKKHSDETKKKQSESHLGENNPMFGKDSPMKNKTHTAETKAKMKKAAKTRPKKSETTKQKMKDAWNRKPILICPHCGKESNHSGNMNRFHFNNCIKNIISASFTNGTVIS